MGTKEQKNRGPALYICAFFVPFLMMQIFWAVCGIFPFGDHSILTGDMDVEFVNFYAYFIGTLKNSNGWSYMFAKTLGGDFPGLAAFQLHDPLLLLLLFFPKENIAAGIELVFTLQVSIAGLCASILLNNRYKRSWMSLLFSTGYAFSSFFFGYLVLTIYFGALAILPLVLFFFLKYVEERKFFIPFVISTCLFIYINYHMGFMLVIFLAILYFSRLLVDRSYIKRLAELLVAGITIILIDGFFLIRTGLSLLGEKTTEGADYGFYRRFPIDQLFAGMLSGCARNDLRPLIYCSVAALFFAVCYFASGRISVREKIANAAVIAVVAVSMWINAIDAVWHGFNNPEGFWWRYAYYISIVTVVIGYKGLLALLSEEDEKKRLRTILVSFFAIALYMAYLTLRGNPYLDRMRLLLNAALLVVIAASSVFFAKEGIKGRAAFILILAVSVAEMLYSSKTSYLCLNTDGDLPLMSKFKEDYRNIDEVISYVKKTDDGFYRIEKDFDRAINDPAMFDYIGLSHDSSCEKDEIIDWLVNFGFCRTVYFTYYNGGSTSFVDDLFGVKYYISRFDSVEKPYRPLPYRDESEYFAYENADALPLVFAAPEGLADMDLSSGNTFEKQNSIMSYWGAKSAYIKTDVTVSTEGAKDLGDGLYKKTGEEGFVVYNIPVTNRMPVYFYFYAPGRQNAEVFVNGESRDVYFTVNHWNTLCAGTYDPGTNLEIKLKIYDDELHVDEACFYYEDAEALHDWGKRAHDLSASVGNVDRISGAHLSFETEAKDSLTVMMSIPYDPAWKISCDGERVYSKPAMGMLTRIDIPEGKHVIDMKYIPRGTYAGIATSLAGILVFVALIWFSRRKED